MIEPKKILVAEDDMNDAELILAALGKYNIGNEVIIVQDGAEALDYLHRRGDYETRAEGNPVLALLDIKMPKVDGLEVLREIRADERLKMIPTAMLTSSRQEGDLLVSYQLGVNAYIVKPVDFNEFAETVRELGVFWLMVNEPPPGSVMEKNGGLSLTGRAD
ncbi:MAG TPA: response regulator [Blastocatellia bacterium]